MNEIDIPFEKINSYLRENPISLQLSYSEDLVIDMNAIMELTGVKNYIRVGESSPHLQYTLTFIPTSPNADKFMKFFADVYGDDIPITTTSREYYPTIRKANIILENLLKYFGIEMPTICTRVVNKVGEEKINEGLLKEDKYDSVVRAIVRDIITIFKKHGKGEYGLPEDLRSNEVYYEFPQIENPLQVYVDMSFNENVEGFDADADYYNDEDLIYVTIVTNPKFGSSFIYDLVGELNELVRHELEHVKQHESGYEFPKREPKKPLNYYSQKHELDAQRKGFQRKKKITGLDYETVVRNWFRDNQQKHRLNQSQAEIVIQRILNEK